MTPDVTLGLWAGVLALTITAVATASVLKDRANRRRIQKWLRKRKLKQYHQRQDRAALKALKSIGRNRK